MKEQIISRSEFRDFKMVDQDVDQKLLVNRFSQIEFMGFFGFTDHEFEVRFATFRIARPKWWPKLMKNN